MEAKCSEFINEIDARPTVSAEGLYQTAEDFNYTECLVNPSFKGLICSRDSLSHYRPLALP